MERLLSQAAAELAVRSEVEAALSSLLHDVEHAHSLECSLRARNELQHCREQLESLRARYEEREAAWEADRREKERLGRALLGEVVAWSAREVRGEREREEVERKLRRLGEEKRRAGDAFLAQQQSSTAVGADKGDVKVEEQKPGGDSSQPVVAEEAAQSASEPSNISTVVGEKQTIPDTTTTAKEGGATEGGDASPATPASAATDQIPPVPAFVPHNLDETTLMNIFAYSDPMDVMNFAQTNKALLAKVNEMFGMIGGEESDVDQPQTTGPSEDAAASVEKTEPPKPATAASTSVTSTAGQTVASTAPSTDATKSATSTPAKSSPKLFGMAGPSHKRQGSSTSVATAGTTGSGGTANPFSQVSSWFGSGDAASVTSGAAANAAASPAATPVDAGSEIKLNGAMASSMASKLTPAELSIILRMREKLQKCEADANQWRLEKEDAVANLASVEAVKEFLVTRVRDTERVVQQQKEDMREKDKKNLEDQEVIVFLDERVKELEQALEAMKSKEAATKQASLDVVTKNEKKTRVLSDMLQFEREQMAASKKEWKAAKKVLVGEVKSCRSRIVALEAEVDGCRRQNAQLKQGLMALSQPSGSTSPRAKKSVKDSGRF